MPIDLSQPHTLSAFLTLPTNPLSSEGTNFILRPRKEKGSDNSDWSDSRHLARTVLRVAPQGDDCDLPSSVPVRRPISPSPFNSLSQNSSAFDECHGWISYCVHMIWMAELQIVDTSTATPCIFMHVRMNNFPTKNVATETIMAMILCEIFLWRWRGWWWIIFFFYRSEFLDWAWSIFIDVSSRLSW